MKIKVIKEVEVREIPKKLIQNNVVVPATLAVLRILTLKTGETYFCIGETDG